jgi:enoyl-CoA hydratase/carnithine racemase
MTTMNNNDCGEVRCERLDRVLQIMVDRASRMNGFTPEMFDGLEDALTRLDEDPELWAGVICFAGANTTAGLDLPRFAGVMREGKASSGMSGRVDPYGLRRRCCKPVVMAVQGITYTIGIEMLLGADIVVAAEDCRFCQMEPRRGLAVFGGAHVRYVQRAGWGNAMYHLLRADEFSAVRALQLGFVQEVVPVGEQIPRAIAIAQEICMLAPLAIQEIKRGALVGLLQGERAGLDEIPAMKLRTAGSEDFAEGLMSFREKRAARFQGR